MKKFKIKTSNYNGSFSNFNNWKSKYFELLNDFGVVKDIDRTVVEISVYGEIISHERIVSSREFDCVEDFEKYYKKSNKLKGVDKMKTKFKYALKWELVDNFHESIMSRHHTMKGARQALRRMGDHERRWIDLAEWDENSGDYEFSILLSHKFSISFFENKE